MPMKAHENVLIFYKRLPIYNPQKTYGHSPSHNYTKHTDDGTNYGHTKTNISGGGNTDRYPRDVLKFKWDTQKSPIHPTQKPVTLLEYLIKTYTNKDMTVLDNCCGSGSTGIACINTNRDCILIDNGFCEKKNKYENWHWIDVTNDRINTYLKNNNLEDNWNVEIE